MNAWEVNMENRMIRFFTLAGIVAAALNIVITAVLDFTVPGYNPITQYVSEFGIIPGFASTIASIWWVLNGLLLIVFSAALNNSIEKAGRLSILGPLLICFYGLFDSVGSVIFPMHEGTFSGVMHNLVSFIGITAVIFSPIALVRRIKNDPLWTKLTRFTWFTQIIFWILYIICLLAFTDVYFTGIIGLLQRVFIFSADIWIAVLACQMLTVHSTKHPDE